MHAFIKYPASLVCPFLSAERLCRIQQDYGADYLCVSCATYPRVPRRIEGLLEAPLSLSCPEAARLVLLDPHLMPCEERAGEARYSRFLAMRERAISANHNPL
jgi:lysine-N-methylase